MSSKKKSSLLPLLVAMPFIPPNPALIYTKRATDNADVFATHLVFGLTPVDGKPTKNQLRRWRAYKKHGDPFNIPKKDRDALFNRGLVV